MALALNQPLSECSSDDVLLDVKCEKVSRIP